MAQGIDDHFIREYGLLDGWRVVISDPSPRARALEKATQKEFDDEIKRIRAQEAAEAADIIVNLGRDLAEKGSTTHVAAMLGPSILEPPPDMTDAEKAAYAGLTRDQWERLK